MSDPLTNDLPTWLDRRLAERGWSVKELATRANLSPSMVFRWRQGYLPHIANARAAATALDVPVLDLLVASGQFTPAEVGATVTATAAVGDLSDDELAQEITNLVREQRRRSEARKRREIPDLGPDFNKLLREVVATFSQISTTPDVSMTPEHFRESFQEALNRLRDTTPNLRLVHHKPAQGGDPETAPETAETSHPVEQDPATLTLYSEGGQRYIAYPADQDRRISTPEQSTPEVTEADHANHDQ